MDEVKFQAIKYDDLWVAELDSAEHQAFYRSIELPEAWLPQLAAARRPRDSLSVFTPLPALGRPS